MTIYIERHHNKDQQAITSLTEKIAGELEQEFGLSWAWQEDRLHINHASAKGYLHAEEGKITIQLQLGFAASLFAAAIEQNISERLDQLLLVGR